MFESLDCLINAVSKIDNSSPTPNSIPKEQKHHQDSSNLNIKSLQSQQYHPYIQHNQSSNPLPPYVPSYSSFYYHPTKTQSRNSNIKSSSTSSPPSKEKEFVQGLPILNGQVNCSSDSDSGYSFLNSMGSVENLRASPAIYNQQPQPLSNQVIFQMTQNPFRQKTSRKRISLQQTECLQNLFDNGMHFPGRDLRERLATKLQLSCRTIQVWFQNRRQTARKCGNVQKTNSAPILSITDEDIVSDSSSSSQDDEEEAHRDRQLSGHHHQHHHHHKHQQHPFVTTPKPTTTTVPIPKERVSIRWMKPIEFTTDANNGTAQYRQRGEESPFVDYSSRSFNGCDVGAVSSGIKTPPSPSESPLPANIPINIISERTLEEETALQQSLNNHITISHLPTNRMAPEPKIQQQ